MKPTRSNAPARPRRFGKLRDRIDRWVSGGANPSDPFYLSNRTWGQKLRFASLIAVPCLILVICLAILLLDVFGLQHPQEIADKPAAQVAAELLPNIAKDIRIDTNRDIEIEDVHIVTSGFASDVTKLMGVARNNTNHVIRKAELTFEITDRNGSREGAVNTLVENLAAKSTAPFQFTIPQHEASFALVRQIKQLE